MNDLYEQVSPDVLSIMNELYGQEVSASCWRSKLYGEPVIWFIAKDGQAHYLFEDDLLKHSP